MSDDLKAPLNTGIPVQCSKCGHTGDVRIDPAPYINGMVSAAAEKRTEDIDDMLLGLAEEYERSIRSHGLRDKGHHLDAINAARRALKAKFGAP